MGNSPVFQNALPITIKKESTSEKILRDIFKDTFCFDDREYDILVALVKENDTKNETSDCRDSQETP